MRTSRKRGSAPDATCPRARPPPVRDLRGGRLRRAARIQQSIRSRDPYTRRLAFRSRRHSQFDVESGCLIERGGRSSRHRAIESFFARSSSPHERNCEYTQSGHGRHSHDDTRRTSDANNDFDGRHRQCCRTGPRDRDPSSRGGHRSDPGSRGGHGTRDNPRSRRGHRIRDIEGRHSQCCRTDHRDRDPRSQRGPRSDPGSRGGHRTRDIDGSHPQCCRTDPRDR